ncbi:MAG: hypothetical protein ACI81O_000638 [Cyclobacteriaceae bacterium]|jgi:hypothetical protein
MIAKYTSRNLLVTELINNFGQYWRETSFYQEFSDVGLPIPTCYYARHDPAMLPVWESGAVDFLRRL